MNDLESIILSLFDEGYTKSEIASQLDETLAKASSETEKAKHDALLTKDVANVYAAMTKYYADKYNDPTFLSANHYSTANIIELLDTVYFDKSTPTDLDDTLTNENFSAIDALLINIQAAFYDYWYYTHNNTEIEITTTEIAYMLESYYNRDHDKNTPALLKNIAELLDVYFMRTRKNYHGKEIYNWFRVPEDFAAYIDAIDFPSNDPFHDIEDDGAGDIYDLLAQAVDTFLAKAVEDYKPNTLTKMFPEPKDIGNYIVTLYKTYKYFETLGLDDKNSFGDILNLLFK